MCVCVGVCGREAAPVRRNCLAERGLDLSGAPADSVYPGPAAAAAWGCPVPADDQLVEAAKKLTGDIEQVPPMYSALHHNVSPGSYGLYENFG